MWQKCYKLECIESTICDFYFIFKFLIHIYSLQNHLMTHTGNMPFLCPKCPRKFTARNKLKIHMMRHNGIKNFTCPHCGLQKTTMPELRIHMNYHTKEKMYPCSFCDAVFAASGMILNFYCKLKQFVFFIDKF